MCQQLGQPRGCLIGWVKVTTYLPTYLPGTPSSSTYFSRHMYMVHALTCTATQPPRARARGNALCRLSERNRDGRRKITRDRVSLVFRDPPQNSTFYASRHKLATIIGSLVEPADLETWFRRSNPEFRINTRYGSADIIRVCFRRCPFLYASKNPNDENRISLKCFLQIKHWSCFWNNENFNHISSTWLSLNQIAWRHSIGIRNPRDIHVVWRVR